MIIKERERGGEINVQMHAGPAWLELVRSPMNRPRADSTMSSSTIRKDDIHRPDARYPGALDASARTCEA